MRTATLIEWDARTCNPHRHWSVPVYQGEKLGLRGFFLEIDEGQAKLGLWFNHVCAMRKMAEHKCLDSFRVAFCAKLGATMERMDPYGYCVMNIQTSSESRESIDEWGMQLFFQVWAQCGNRFKDLEKLPIPRLFYEPRGELQIDGVSRTLPLSEILLRRLIDSSGV